MSDRDPNADWEQPRGDFSRGGAPHYSGNPYPDRETPDAGTSTADLRKARKWMVIAIVYGIVGLAAVVTWVVFLD